MPRAPEVRTSIPGEGSVGRLRINAPVEAFGGGAAAQGLAQMGQGLQNVGQGVRDIQAASDRRKQEELERQQKLAKAQADRQKKINELRNDRLMLTYNQRADALHGKIKETPTSGSGITKQDAYLQEATKLREDVLKDTKLLPEEKEEMLIKMEEGDLKRVKTLISAQSSEDEKYRQDTRKAQKGNIITSMRDSHAELTKDNVSDWFQGHNASSGEYAKGLLSDGVQGTVAGDEVNSTRAQGFKEAIREKMAGLSNSTTPVGDGENIAAILDQVPPRIMSNEEKDEYKELIKKKSEARVKALEGQATKAKNLQLDEFANTLANIDNDYDKDIALADFTSRNTDPAVKSQAETIYRQSKMQTPFTSKEKWASMLIESKNVDAYKEKLFDALKSGEIGLDVYSSLKADADTKISSRKKIVFEGVKARLGAIKLNLDIDGMKKLPGSVGWTRSDVEVTDELIKKWDNLWDMMKDPNVTDKEINQLADAMLFKPEAYIATKNAEDRLTWGTLALSRMAAEPGTQKIDEKLISPSTKASRLSDDELMMKILGSDEYDRLKNNKEKSMSSSVADEIRSTFEK